MNAQEFISSKGNITDPNIRFLKAGETVIIPLEDLLYEFASYQPTPEEAVAAAKVQEVKPRKVKTAETKPKKK